jgi:hypothetical protein
LFLTIFITHLEETFCLSKLCVSSWKDKTGGLTSLVLGKCLPEYTQHVAAHDGGNLLLRETML